VACSQIGSHSPLPDSMHVLDSSCPDAPFKTVGTDVLRKLGSTRLPHLVQDVGNEQHSRTDSESFSCSAALVLMLLLELGVETCVRHKLLGTSGYHTLYDWYQQVGNEHFPDPTGLRLRMEEWTYGFYPACVKYLMDSFDVPEVRGSCEPQN
jgi:hypothetical protein